MTNALANKIRALHAKLRASLEELYAWMAAANDDPQADVKLSESDVSGMLQGNPAPWQPIQGGAHDAWAPFLHG